MQLMFLDTSINNVLSNVPCIPSDSEELPKEPPSLHLLRELFSALPARPASSTATSITSGNACICCSLGDAVFFRRWLLHGVLSIELHGGVLVVLHGGGVLDWVVPGLLHGEELCELLRGDCWALVAVLLSSARRFWIEKDEAISELVEEISSWWTAMLRLTEWLSNSDGCLYTRHVPLAWPEQRTCANCSEEGSLAAHPLCSEEQRVCDSKSLLEHCFSLSPPCPWYE